MINEQNKKSIMVKNKGKREPIEFKTLVKVENADNGDLVNVLNVSAFCKISQRENFDNEEVVSGITTVFVTCEKSDGSLIELKKQVEWQEKVSVLDNVNLLLEPKVVDYQIMGKSDNGVSVQLLHNLFIEEIFEEEVGVTIEDEFGLEKDTENFTISKVVASANSAFSINEEWETNLSPNTSILMRNIQVIVENVYAGVDCVTVDGKLVVSLVVDNDGEVDKVNHIIDFKKECECFGVSPGNVVLFKANVSDGMVGIRQNENSSTVLVLDTEIGSTVVCYAEENIVVVRDCFSAINKTSIGLETVNYNYINNLTYNNADVEWGIPIDSKVGVDEIISLVEPQLNIISCNYEQGVCNVEAVASVNVVYKNNQNNTVETYLKECPLCVKLEMSENTNKIDNLSLVVEGYKLKTGTEISVDGKLYYECYNEKIEQITYVCNIEFKDEKMQDDVAIKVYCVQSGETLFDIAKNLEVTISNLITQNPDLENGIVEGEKVFIYSPLVVDFQ